MWVADLVIAIQKAKQRKEKQRTWHLDIERLLKHQHHRFIRQRAENIKLKRP